MVTNRNNVLDVLSGIFILRMVYTHTCMYAGLDDHTVLFDITGMFLMWFFFKGGMLVKETKKYPEILVSSREKLLKPFICLAIISIILDSVLYLIDTVNGGYYHSNEIIRTIGSLAINGSPHSNMPIWFLFSYCVVRVFFGCQRTFFKQISFWGVLLVCVLIPYLLHFCSFRYPYYFANIFIGLLEYYIGYIYKKRAEKYANILVPISAFLYIGIFVLCHSVVDIRTNTLYSGYYLLWTLWSISGCMFFYYIFNKIRFLSQFFTVLGIARIGELSMTVLVLHWPALIMADFVKFYCLDIPKNYCVIYYLTIVLVVSVVLHKYLKQTKLKFLIGL